MRRTVNPEMVERRPFAGAREERLRADSDPDRDLVDRWRGGDAAAFEALVRRHETRVFRLLVRMLGSREDAEDVAQEVFLNLHRHGHRFRGDARFSTFVYRVAANAALNRRRTLGRLHAREALHVRHEMTSEPAAGDPEAALAARRTHARVEAALLRLPPTLRLPVLLCDVEGLGYGEIAQVLELAEGTVKSRIHRARRALRELLGAATFAEGTDGR